MTKKPQLSILFFLFSFGNVLGLLFTAALPNLTQYFEITKDAAQQTLSVFLLGYTFGMLIYGPLSNALGRKSALYMGIILSFFGSLLCIVSIELHSFNLMLFGRLITALGSCCGVTLTLLFIADAYSHSEAKKPLSYLFGGFALFPAIGINIGGFITEYLSWQSCFYFMLIYSAFIFVLMFFLPETLKEKDLKHLRPKTVLKSYLRQGNNLIFILAALIVACPSSVLYVFSAEAPFISINQIKLSPDQYGLYNLIPYFGLIIGGIISAQLSQRLSTKSIILLGASIYLFTSLIMLTVFQLGYINIFSLFVIPSLIFAFIPAIMSNGSLLALKVSTNKSYAASFLNSLMSFIIFLTLVCLGFFPQENSSVLPIVYTLLSLLLIILWILSRNLKAEPKS